MAHHERKDGFARLRDVMEFTQLSKSTVESEVRAGTFPSPYPISKGGIGWKWPELYAWYDAR